MIRLQTRESSALQFDLQMNFTNTHVPPVKEITSAFFYSTDDLGFSILQFFRSPEK